MKFDGEATNHLSTDSLRALYSSRSFPDLFASCMSRCLAASANLLALCLLLATFSFRFEPLIRLLGLYTLYSLRVL